MKPGLTEAGTTAEDPDATRVALSAHHEALEGGGEDGVQLGGLLAAMLATDAPVGCAGLLPLRVARSHRHELLPVDTPCPKHRMDRGEPPSLPMLMMMVMMMTTTTMMMMMIMTMKMVMLLLMVMMMEVVGVVVMVVFMVIVIMLVSSLSTAAEPLAPLTSHCQSRGVSITSRLVIGMSPHPWQTSS